MNIFYGILLFVLTLLGQVTVAVDYYNSNGVRYINPDSASNTMSWLDAQTYCRYLDSTLAILDTPNATQSFRSALTYFGLNSTDTWIGANATYVEGNWKWLNGANYTGPAVQGAADFIHSYGIISKPQTAITVAATSAIYVYNYLCQYTATSSYCGSVRTFLTPDGFCYVVSNDKTPWFTARNNCLMNGGDLAVFQDFNSISQYMSGTEYWIGLRGSFWKWQNGADLTFSFWANSQPNDDSADCMSIRSDSASDNICNVQFRFVCQKGVPSSSSTTSTTRTTSTTTLRSSTLTSTTRSSTPTSTSTSTTHSLDSPKYIPTALSSVMSSVETSSSDPNSTIIDTSTHSSLGLAIGIAVGVGVPVIAIIIAVIAVIAYRCGRKKRNADERNARDQGANVPENSSTYLELEKASRIIKANEYAKLELPLDKLKEQEVTTDKPYMNISELSEYANHSEIE